MKNGARPIIFLVRDLPIEVFGNQHGRHTRKLVLMMIASYANPDGSNCYPSVATIAQNCGLSVRGAQKNIEWLREAKLLDVAAQAGPQRTNLFMIHPEMVNANVQGERHSSGCTETNGRVNGEPARVNAAALIGERQSSPDLQIPSRRPLGPTAPSFMKADHHDPRHAIGEMITTLYLQRFGLDCTWGAREEKELNRLLQHNKKWTVDDIRRMVENYFKSEINSAEPGEFISKLPSYFVGPLDRFNKHIKPITSEASIGVNRGGVWSDVPGIDGPEVTQ